MYEDIAYPQEQWQLFVDLFKQVADQNKLAVIHTGNHERRIQKKAGIDPVAQAAAAMQVEDRHAPFHAETTIKIKCNQNKMRMYNSLKYHNLIFIKIINLNKII